MKQSEAKELIDLRYVGNGFVPINRKAIELCESLKIGDEVMFKNVTGRDLKFHRCYFDLLAFIYGYMPLSVTKRVTKDNFYIFLKHLAKEYTVIHTFKDGTQQVEYNSISFGRMNQNKFELYVKNQLQFIYSDLLLVLFDDETAANIMGTIEAEYKKFLSKL